MESSIFQQLIGQTIDRYKVISVLGEGGMGAVLKGYDVTLQREVAVKMMHPHLANQPNFQERFLQEARTAARLDNANIVQVYTFGQYRSMLYIIMKFIPGDNLEQMLQDLRAEKSWLVLREALEIIRQVSMAMDYAHRSGVLHRDLKPSNIMIEPVPSEGLPYRPVITDLGLAKLASGGLQTMEGTSMGTPAYMSPEQALGKETDPCSDVYSLGIMLYELCTGRLPFAARNLPEAIQAHVNQAPPPPRSIRADLPEALEAVILKALEKEPARRFQNAAELAKAVQAVPLAEQTQQAAPTAMESAISLITQYKKSLEKPRGPSLMEEFKTPPSLSRDLIQVLTPDKKTADVPLGPQGANIGREADNEVILSDPQSSRHHARVEISDGEVRIIDLNSTNGTFMENVRLLPGVPEPWSEEKGVRIGKTWLRLRRGASGGTQPQPRYAGVAGGFTGARPAAGTRGGTQIEPGSVHTSGDSGRVNVTMPSAQIAVEPGATISLPITLQNQGALVDRFTITLKGVPQTWLPEPVKVVPMMPGDQKEVTLVIRPPRSPQSRAGRHALVLHVASQQAAGQPVEVRLTLTVGAYSEFSSEMRPSKVRPGQPSRLYVRNKGNAQESFTVQWKDRGDELAFKPPQAKLRIPEDREGEVIFVAAPRHRRLVGAEKTYTFTAQVSAESGQNQVHNGELVSKPPLPTWVLALPLVACLLLAAAAGMFWNNENNRIAGQTATFLAIEGQAATQVESIIQTQTFVATSMIGANQATVQAATATAEWLAADDDRDGLTNAQELELNTLPNKPDTDEDGLSDGDEVNIYNTNPLRDDTDGDGLKDGVEVTMGLNPNSKDTDGDGLEDAVDPDPKNLPTGTPTPTATITPTPTSTPTPTGTPTRTPTAPSGGGGGGFILTPGIFEPPVFSTLIFQP